MFRSTRSSLLADVERARIAAEHIRALVHGAQLALDAAMMPEASPGVLTADALLVLAEQQRRTLTSILDELAQSEVRAA